MVIYLSTSVGVCMLDQGAITVNLSAKGCEWIKKDLNDTQGPKRNPHCFRGLMMDLLLFKTVGYHHGGLTTMD